MARNGKNFVSFIAILMLMVSVELRAGSMTGELDKVDGTIDDQFVYTLSVQGNADGEPQFPAIPGLDVQRAGTSQNVSIVNNHMSREVQYQYIIVAAKEAKYVIPAISLKIDGKSEQTLPLEINVKAASPSGDHSDSPIFLERSFSKTKVYIGESIIASVRLFRRVRVMSAEPDFWNYPDAFQVKKLDGQKNYRKNLNGKEYEVTEINSILLPTKQGHYEITPALLEARFASGQRRAGGLLDDLLGQSQTSSKRIRTESSSIEVLPLPLNGRRADFSGLVGEFQGRAELSAREIKLGETLTLTLMIEGKGSTAGMAEPMLDLGTRAKIYRDKAQSSDSYDAGQGVLGRRSYKLAIVPSQGGTLELGTLTLQYFNSTLGQYQDLNIPLGTVSVQGGAPATDKAQADGKPGQTLQAQGTASEKQGTSNEVKALASDLLEPHAADRLQSSDSLHFSDIIASTSLMTLSFMSLGFGAWRARIRRQGRRHDVLKKSAKALKSAQRQLKAAQEFLNQRDLQSASGLAQKVIRQYLGDRFDIKGSSLTLRDLEQHLHQRGLDEGTLRHMRGVWQNLDQLLFATESSSLKDGQVIIEQVNTLLQEVEQKCVY